MPLRRAAVLWGGDGFSRLSKYNGVMSGSAAAIITTLKIRRTQRDLVQRFESVGAIGPDRAIPRGELGRLSELVFSKLARDGVFVTSGEDRWYVDLAAYDRFQPRQRHRSLVTAGVIVLVVAGLFTLWLAR